MDVSEKHTYSYPKNWRVIKCPVSFYKNKTGYEGILSKHGIKYLDVLYLSLSNCVKNISNLLVYCDFNRRQYPHIIAIKNLPDVNEKDILEAFFIRGYRSIPVPDDAPIPECKHLLVFRNQSTAFDKLA